MTKTTGLFFYPITKLDKKHAAEIKNHLSKLGIRAYPTKHREDFHYYDFTHAPDDKTPAIGFTQEFKDPWEGLDE